MKYTWPDASTVATTTGTGPGSRRSPGSWSTTSRCSSLLGGFLMVPGFQGLVDGWKVLKPGQPLWATARHPAAARWTKGHWKTWTHYLAQLVGGFALRCSSPPSWGLGSTTWSRPLTNDWGFAQQSPNYLTIRISIGAYGASGHVPAVDDDLRFKNPY